MTNPLPTESVRKHPYKCPAHNMWMRKGQCEICRLNADIKRKQIEATTGSNKPEIKITKI